MGKRCFGLGVDEMSAAMENNTGEQNFQRDGFITTNLEQVLNLSLIHI